MSTRRVRVGPLTIACLWIALPLGGARYLPVHAQEAVGGDTYQYNPEGKRDPFLSPFYRQPEQEVPEEARTPLQRFDLGQLKLVGVILEEEPRALIEDNGGLGYIVTKGTPIGSKGGVVKAIEPRRVVVEEYEIDFYGQRQIQERELPLVVGSAAEGAARKPK